MHCTVEPCPVDYFGSESKRAERVITYFGDQKVSTWDVFCNDDTRYFLFFEAEPNFRNKRWLELVATYEPGSLARFDRPNAVWFRTGEWVVEDKQHFVNSVKNLGDKGVLHVQKVFSEGALTEIIDLI